jgi:hypothetical protein
MAITSGLKAPARQDSHVTRQARFSGESGRTVDMTESTTR